MNGQLRQVTGADGDVKCHPCNGKPTGPILGQQQKYGANNGERLGDFDPDPVGLPALGKVSDKSANSDRKVKAGNQYDSQRDPLALARLGVVVGNVHGLM